MRDKQHKPVHTVVLQGAVQCVHLWKRDVSTCRNIRDVSIHENSHQGQRREKFTRASLQHEVS